MLTIATGPLGEGGVCPACDDTDVEALVDGECVVPGDAGVTVLPD